MRILVIEDDIQLCDTMKHQLAKAGYAVDACYSGEDGQLYGELNSYDCILLDRMLPKTDGLTILRELRKKGITVCVIMITAMGALEDRIEGLDRGADDYIIKPFEMEELLARIRANLRRPRVLENSEILTFSDLSLNLGDKILTSDSASCHLSRKEAELLEYFFRNRGQLLTRELILLRVWGPDRFAADGNLDNFISFLRKRFKTLKSRAAIKTIYGTGYRLEEANFPDADKETG